MGKQTMDDVVVPVMVIWDTINDLCRLRGIADALAYLTRPERSNDDDAAADMLHEVFNDFSERLDAACDTLETARKNPRILKSEEARP